MQKKLQTLPISSIARLPRINDVRFSADGSHLVWHETVDGQGNLKLDNGKNNSILISADQDVRGGIGYGGGEFGVGKSSAVFSARSGGLFLVALEPPFIPKQLSSKTNATASACVSPDENWVLFIDSFNEADALAICRLGGHNPAVQVVRGADFYSQPSWHPDNKMIAWVEWHHPYMPWDASRIRIGEFDPESARVILLEWTAGGAGFSASQPCFSPDGRWLSYIIRAGNWDNLMMVDLKTREESILVKGDGFHLRQPEWVQGMHSCGWADDSRSIYYFRYHRAETTLWKVGVLSGQSQQIDIAPIRWATQLAVSPKNGGLAFIGSAPAIPKQVCRLLKGVLSREAFELEKQLDTIELKPEHLEFLNADGNYSYGLYYPPDGEHKKSAALIFHVHGGPTAVADLGFNHEAVFFTNRGYGVAEINYRGSSSYGYSYQDALRERWGIVDVKDTIAMAEKLIALGYADPRRMGLIGSSAGGFTVLNTLIQKPGLFKCGICSYGVSDLLVDAQTTHKFERYYHQFLVGSLEKDRQRFIDRSPITMAGRIDDPLLLFHGDQDHVVEISQTRQIHHQLDKRGVPCQIVIYAGEGHGFRKIETISDYYQKIEDFLLRYLI